MAEIIQQMDLKIIIERLRTEADINPNELSQILVYLSAEYSFLATGLQEAAKDKPSVWLILRNESKSAAEASKKWEASEPGKLERRLYWQMKSCEKLMSSIKARLRVKEVEAKAIW